MSPAFLSVIIPIYNAEKYLRPCLDSVLRSSYPHFELILVNDGSTDGSLAVCEEYAARDSRIRLFSQENGGVSSARNKGIDESQGEWLIFIDADDLISPDFLGPVAREGLQSADFLLFDFAAAEGQLDTGIPDAKGIFYSKGQMTQLLQRALVPKQLVENGNVNFNSSNARAFKKSIIDRYHIRFAPDISFGEDKLFNLEYQMRAESCRYLPYPVYFYRFHEDSLSHRYTPDFLRNRQELFQSIKGVLEAGGMFQPVENDFYSAVLTLLAFMLLRVIFSPANRKPYREKRERCHLLREAEIYRQALRYNRKNGTLRQKLVIAAFQLRFYRLISLFARISFMLLKIKNPQQAEQERNKGWSQ